MKYFVSYRKPYGGELIRAAYSDQKSLLAFIAEAKSSPDDFQSLGVVYGNEVEFEPHLIVQSWRIKE